MNEPTEPGLRDWRQSRPCKHSQMVDFHDNPPRCRCRECGAEFVDLGKGMEEVARPAVASPPESGLRVALIHDLFDAIFAIPVQQVDADTGAITNADPTDVKDAALGAVIRLRLALADPAPEGGADPLTNAEWDAVRNRIWSRFR